MQLENDMIKPADEKLPIIDKSNPISNLNNTTMTENEIKVVAAQLGFTGEKATSENVSARIKELLGVEAKYNDLKLEFETKSQALTAAETKNKGLETSVQNLQKNYDEVKSKLDVFEKAAAEKAKLEIEAMVDEAIAAGKIEKESRDTWISQAQANLELTKNVLGSIPARVQISKQISKDPNNVNAAEKGMTTAEQKVEEKVQAAVGKDFKFREPKF
jgi:archaellum component FlaC